MKVAVVGAGAMGALLGGRLARARHLAVCVDDNPGCVGTIDARPMPAKGSTAPCRAVERAGIIETRLD